LYIILLSIYLSGVLYYREVLISLISEGKFHKIDNFVFYECNECFADDWRALLAIWRLHLK